MMESEMKSAPKNRCGRFTIDSLQFNTDFEAMQAIFALCVPVKAEFLYASNQFEYFAIGDVFDEIPSRCEAPYYTVSVTRDGENELEIKFQRRST